MSIYLVILSWTPLAAMAFWSGLILRQLVEWALTRTQCRQPLLGGSLAAASAVIFRQVNRLIALTTGNNFKYRRGIDVANGVK